MKKLFLPQMRPLVRAVRAYTRDNMMTFDGRGQTHDSLGNHLGVPFGFRVQAAAYQTNDGKIVRERVYDSSGAFLVGELERLDQKLHEPLVSTTWGRDIDLREDVSLADETSSYTVSSYGAAGGLGIGNGIGNGKHWIGKVTNQISGQSVDIAKVVNPLTLWGQEMKYTIPELESAAKIGRPIDAQKYSAMQMKHQMDIDEQVYIGDTSLGATGLINANNRTGLDRVTNVANVVAGAAGSPLWTLKTPDEILADVNEILVSAWTASGYAVMPGKILLPPQQFGYISTQKISLAGNTSILKYILENNISITSGNGKLDIQPAKWCVGAGVGGTIGTVGIDRMVAYTKSTDRVRFPMTMLQKTPIQFDSIWHKTTYFCRLGVVEIVYPETIAYRDGL